jgi:16S rRNA (guanine966-N2)-methyltransferase
LRIIGGELKGRKLVAVRGANTRPTADRIREAIFNILNMRVRGTMVLDLFAGTGALGIEALSRGAQYACFLDVAKGPLSALKRNLAACGLENRAKIIHWDVLKNLNCIRSIRPLFNLVFMDPPYHKNMIAPALINLQNCRCLQSSAGVVVEHSQLEPIAGGDSAFKITDQRRYGKTLVSFLDYML